MTVRRYRYRTAALTGPWRETRAEAVRRCRQGQAGRDRRRQDPDGDRMDRAGPDRGRCSGARGADAAPARRPSARSSSARPRSAQLSSALIAATKRVGRRRRRAPSSSRPRIDVRLGRGELAQRGELDAVAGMARGEAFDQVAAVAAAMIGGEREQRLGRGPGEDAGDLALLHVEPVLAEEGQAGRRLHDVDRDRHVVGRQLVVDVPVRPVEHHLARLELRLLDEPAGRPSRRAGRRPAHNHIRNIRSNSRGRDSRR